MPEKTNDFKRQTQKDLDIALAHFVHAGSFVDHGDCDGIRDRLREIAQVLMDEFYPELTHQRDHVDAGREWLASVQPEGVA